MPNLPTISIVVPNYNGAATIARTLQSLVDQDYPGLEILVTDGGSTDGSQEIIRSFEKHIAWWISEKDRGQSDAINKGFAHATGDVVNWLCSDDTLLPGALKTVGKYFVDHPETDIVAGACRYVYVAKGIETINRPSPVTFALMPCINTMGQAAVFYRRSVLDRPGPLREELCYTMDLDLWCHFIKSGRRWAFVDDVLAEAVEDGHNKTSTGGMKIVREMRHLYSKYSTEWITLPFWYVNVLYPMRQFMTGAAPVPLRGLVRQLRRGVTGLLMPFYGLNRIQTMECWGQFLAPVELEQRPSNQNEGLT